VRARAMCVRACVSAVSEYVCTCVFTSKRHTQQASLEMVCSAKGGVCYPSLRLERRGWVVAIHGSVQAERKLSVLGW
jgi:hypothetical protein